MQSTSGEDGLAIASLALAALLRVKTKAKLTQ